MWWNRVKGHIFDVHGMTLPAWINSQWFCRIIYARLLLCLKFEGTFSDMLICLLMRKIYIWIHLIYTCPVVINIHSYNENYNVMCNLQHSFFFPHCSSCSTRTSYLSPANQITEGKISVLEVLPWRRQHWLGAISWLWNIRRA